MARLKIIRDMMGVHVIVKTDWGQDAVTLTGESEQIHLAKTIKARAPGDIVEDKLHVTFDNDVMTVLVGPSWISVCGSAKECEQIGDRLCSNMHGMIAELQGVLDG